MHKVELFGVRMAPSRTAQALCVITAGVAFVLGTVIGVLIPLYVLPPLLNSPETAAATEAAVVEPLTRRPTQLTTPTPEQRQTPTRPPVMPNMDELHVVTMSPHWRSTSALPETSEEASLQSPSVNASEPQEKARLTDGIFWSESVEAELPAGVDDEAVESWREFVRHSALIKVEEGCGRMQNRLLTFENGTQSCCRYRQNFDQIQGEIFSFLLSRRLGIRNLPPTSLMLVKPSDWQWAGVRSQLSLAQWAEGRPVVVTRFREQLAPAYIPEVFRRTDRRLHPTDLALRSLTLESDRDVLVELAQWSDLIIFDYLTANLDRIVNNLYNQQWNPSMMEAPAHNLARDTNTGLLMFLDNESGLLHGYRLLDKYEPYHRTLLDATCVFRRETVEQIRAFHKSGELGSALRRNFKTIHPDVVDFLPTLPEKSIKILKQRIDNVHEVIERCERTYGS